jgi:hypothetical protein
MYYIYRLIIILQGRNKDIKKCLLCKHNGKIVEYREKNGLCYANRFKHVPKRVLQTDTCKHFRMGKFNPKILKEAIKLFREEKK